MKTSRLFALATALFLLPMTAHAAMIWSSGPDDITFTKANNADPTLPANQDQITPGVAITRGDTMGIYNADTEESYNVEDGDIDVDNVSPEDTEWAFSGINNNPTFSYGQGAAEYSSLNFSDWETAAGGGGFPANLVDNAAVVHLIAEDIYIDLQFTSWGVGKADDNSFSYIRAVAPSTAPEPASMAFLASSLLLLARRRRSARHAAPVMLL